MNKSLFLYIVLSMGLCSCEDWITETSPMTTTLEDFFTDGSTALQAVNACYVPLMWEYNETYYPEWFIGDVVSDDALKGGQNTLDMADVYDLENFKTIANNTLLLDFYRAQYQGISRCNLAISQISKMDTDETMDEDKKNRLIGEAKYLRAYYYFRLVRMFGDVPYVDEVILSSDEWKKERVSKDKIYEYIVSDLDDAQKYLLKKSEYLAEDMGRATSGAAQAMLMKVHLYMHDYDKAKSWGDTFMQTQTGEYSLCTDYKDNFTLAGEMDRNLFLKCNIWRKAHLIMEKVMDLLGVL